MAHLKLNEEALIDKRTVGHAATNDTITNECYNEQFISIVRILQQTIPQRTNVTMNNFYQNQDATTNAEQYYQADVARAAHYVSGLLALIRASVSIFIVIRFS
jgi:hypothetical protein